MPKQTTLLKLNTIIRTATENDFEEIINLFSEFAAFEKQPDKMVNTLEKMKTESAFFHCFVAVTHEGTIVGYATYFFAYFTWVGKSLYMDDLYVKPEFRGRGIGTQLIKAVIAYAKEAKCAKVRWQVSHWNTPAIEFYNSLGAKISTSEYNCDLSLK